MASAVEHPPAEALFVAAIVMGEQAGTVAERDRCARWLVAHHDLIDIEAAVLLAVDPPTGAEVDLVALMLLVKARQIARAAVPPSPEAGCLAPPGDDAMRLAVEDIFDGFAAP